MKYLSVLLLCTVSLVNGIILPKPVIPTNYRLDIVTHFGKEDMEFNFEARAQITIFCVESTAHIILHSKDLEIAKNGVSIRNVTSSSEVVKVREIFEKKHDFLTIYLDKYLEKGHSYQIDIPYWGRVNDGLEGFYRSSYKDSKTNETKWLGVTQFQAINARRAFPCFDDDLNTKVYLELYIARKDGYKSISNMPLINTMPIVDRPGWFWDQFDKSVPMSTYLFAWVVSDFEAKESKHELNNVTFKIWSRKDALDQTTFASEVGPKILIFIENYFDAVYTLPKMDLVAIPDLAVGAMENWGLITFRENFLLYDPKVSTKSDQRQVAHVIAHELAHQWFGNSVTIFKWNDLWLHEGFATYMSAIAVHHLFPEWNFLEEDHVNSMLDVFSFDSLRSSRPVRGIPTVNPLSSKEINQFFDKITYKKGSCLIKMMSSFLGKETFKSGVINYLKHARYSNVYQSALFDSLTEAAHKESTLPKNWTVDKIMFNWINNYSGFPVILVNRNYKTGSAKITQKQFLKDTHKPNTNALWWVPLTYSTKSEPHFNITTPKYWLNDDTHESITIENIANEDDWVVFNNKMSGVYKVNYDKNNWKLLANVLKKDHTQIPALNRALLFSDAADLAYIGDLPYDVFFDLFEYLEYETDYLVLATAFTKLEEMESHLNFNPPEYSPFLDYMKILLTPMYEKLHSVVWCHCGYEDEENADKIKIQILIVSLSCKYGVQKCLNDVQKLFKRFEKHPEYPNPIPNDLARIVYCNAIQRGGAKEWNFLWKKFESSNVESEKIMILSVLGCTSEEGLIKRYLEWSLDKSKIRNQDCGTVFSSVASGSDLGYSITKKFFYENVEEIAQYLKDKSSLSTFISALKNRMHDLNDLEEFKNFTKNEKNEIIFSGVSDSVNQALETIKIHTQWQAKHSQTIHAVLLKYVSKIIDIHIHQYNKEYRYSWFAKNEYPF